MLNILTFFLAIQASGQVQYEQPAHEEVQTRLETCGFEHVTVGYQEALRSDVVAVTDETASDEEVLCAAKALDSTIYISLFEPGISERFSKFSDDLARPRLRTLAEEYFAERPELGEPPTRLADETDAALAKRIETFCGPKATGAFAAKNGRIAISASWIKAFIQNGDAWDAYFETYGCLYRAALFADMRIGIIGNDLSSAAEPAEPPATE